MQIFLCKAFGDGSNPCLIPASTGKIALAKAEARYGKAFYIYEVLPYYGDHIWGLPR
jgi:hypothetical protein